MQVRPNEGEHGKFIELAIARREDPAGEPVPVSGSIGQVQPAQYHEETFEGPPDALDEIGSSVTPPGAATR